MAELGEFGALAAKDANIANRARSEWLEVDAAAVQDPIFGALRSLG